jgi:hypothetical protein
MPVRSDEPRKRFTVAGPFSPRVGADTFGVWRPAARVVAARRSLSPGMIREVYPVDEPLLVTGRLS